MKKTIASVVLLCAGYAQATSLGLKNFREYPAALSLVTRIPQSHPAVAPAIKKVSAQLPLKGLVEEMSSPFMLSITELSGAYCNQLILNETPKPNAERVMFRNIDFTTGVKQFTPAVRTALLNEMAESFWGHAPNEDEAATMQKAIDETISGVSTSATETVNVLKSLCSNFATSLEFIVD